MAHRLHASFIWLMLAFEFDMLDIEGGTGGLRISTGSVELSSFQEVEGSESGRSVLGKRLSHGGFYSGIRLLYHRS